MSCVLYLVRHGIAVPADPHGDAERQLTPEGARKMRRAALGLKRLGVVPTVLLSSPLRRAEETAALLNAVLRPAGAEVEVLPALAPGNPTDEVLNGLRRYRRARSIMCVGHEPDLGHLASHLLTGSASLLNLEFKKGGVVAIEVAAVGIRAPGTLVWFLSPKQLRLMARRKA